MIKKKIVCMAVFVLAMHNIEVLSQAIKHEIMLKRVDEKSIAIHKNTLQNTLFYKQIARVGIKSIAMVVTLYGTWKYIEPWIKTRKAHAYSSGAQPPVSHEALVADVALLKNIANPAWFSSQWFKNNGLYIANTFIAGSFASLSAAAISHANTALFHSDSLEWFIQNKTNLADLCPFKLDPRTFMYLSPVDLQVQMSLLKDQDKFKKSIIDELREYLNLFDGLESVSQENKAMNLYLIKSTCNSLILSIELILGFMALKQDKVSVDLADEISFNGRCIIHNTNAFCDKLDNLIADINLDGKVKKQESISALNALRGELVRIIRRFIAIEHEHNV